MKTPSNKVDFSAAFGSLRQRFEESLPQRSAAMLKTVQHAASAQMLRDIVSESHKLAGACGTFGHAMLGAMARQIEQLAHAIKLKSAHEQEQAIPELVHMVQEFDIAVTKAVTADKVSGEVVPQVMPLKSTVWILHDDTGLSREISEQLSSFGLSAQVFADFASCVQHLSQQAPAILLSAVSLASGESFFNQKLLLNTLIKQQIRLMLVSETDSFTQRILAAQQRAEAFFVRPLNVPEVMTYISELLDYGTTNQGRVFIVDDDKLLAEHYALVLNAIGIETRINQRITDIVDEVMQYQPDLIIMDMYMPEYSGADIAGLLRQYRVLKRIPIVFLSSELNKSLQIRAMSHGADDFITKPIDDVQLAQAIKVRLARSLQLKNLIEKDSLTSLVKHGAIKDTAELEFVRRERSTKPLSIVMLDIDHFKAVNDSFGHATGDLVITALATLLRKRIRKTDRAGRYGGEEFLLVLPDCDSQQAKVLTEQILEAFKLLQFAGKDRHFSCTFSAGVVSSDDKRFENSGQMIAAADKALYQAKAAGRKQVICWTPD